MLRLTRRTGLLLVIYVSPLLVALIAGFLAAAVGLWAAILWGVVLVAGLALYIRNRRRSVQGAE